MRFKYVLVVAMLVASTSALAQVINPAPSGGFTDGDFNPTATNTYVALASAVTGAWDSASSGAGVYDPEQWAVVYKYTSVNVAVGKTVFFTAHPSGAPVVWLVNGDVTISGIVNLDGVAALGSTSYAAGGPGGFRGGKGYMSLVNPCSAGFGPGGGNYGPPATGGSYASTGGISGGVTYGNDAILPLVGGSGGGGLSTSNYCGGGGGGAILIIANGTITVNGNIYARGGEPRGSDNTNVSGGGSGGAIRLAANSIITGASSSLIATCFANFVPSRSFSGGAGRIRIEANTMSVLGATNPAYKFLQPLPIDGAQIWPSITAPKVQISTVDGQAVAADPTGAFAPPGDVQANTAGAIAVEILATNVPTNWTVQLRATSSSGAAYVVGATLASGDDASSMWSATLQPLAEFSFVALQAHAVAPVSP
jgi:hypothetical protein